MLGKSKKSEWQPLKPFTVYNNTTLNLGIYSKEDFEQLLHYERIRSDRSNSHFSLVVFEVDQSRYKRSDAKAFIDDIRANVRTIDHVGWFKKRVAVLLPETSRNQAMLFVKSLKKRAAAEMVPFTVYSYPDRSSNDRPEKESCDVGDDKTGKRQFSLYSAESGRISISEQLKSVFCIGIPVWKRSLDIAGSAAGIILLSPLFLLLAGYIKAVSPGPVLYRSKRVGMKGKSFMFLKFRSMHVDNNQSFHGNQVKDLINNNGSWAKMDERDSRIIPGGRILRKVAVDELPQLFSILKGDMSLVGPRPCLPYEAEEFRRWHTYRFDTMPGLTGLWQVSGKDFLSFEEMIRLDIAYARRMSLWLDLRIIARTPFAIIGLVMRAVLRRIPPPDAVEQKVSVSNIV
jgi:lipopolysaccharide/colanic/teichoic acid biosynthesis glycosyltransferase